MMERALKERIIGAIVLVVFVILVVPVFLDGPPAEDRIVSEQVLLPGQEGQNTKTIVLNRERSEPMPLAGGVQSDAAVGESPAAEPVAINLAPKPAPQRESVDLPQESTPVAQAEPEEVDASTTGMWAVQLGSFSNKENAEKLAADLRKQGYAAFLSQLQTDSGQLHRVRIGPQKDRGSAEAVAAKLLQAKRRGQVVPHP